MMHYTTAPHGSASGGAEKLFLGACAVGPGHAVIKSMTNQYAKPKATAERLRIDNMLIDAAGGTVSVADICGVGAASVSNWRSKGIPEPWLRYLRLRLPAGASGASTK